MLLAVLYSLATFVLARLVNFGGGHCRQAARGGRLPAGRYPLWARFISAGGWRTGLGELPDVFLLAGTPWMPLYLRALGARIGRNVTIDMITLARAGAPHR